MPNGVVMEREIVTQIELWIINRWIHVGGGNLQIWRLMDRQVIEVQTILRWIIAALITAQDTEDAVGFFASDHDNEVAIERVAVGDLTAHDQAV